MNPDQLAFGFLEYVVFLLSTTCHEASHALVAKWGGDTTALEGGQVSLNPLPHIKREPFGMVIVPLARDRLRNGIDRLGQRALQSRCGRKNIRNARRGCRWRARRPISAWLLLAGIADADRSGDRVRSFRSTPSFAHIVGTATPGGRRRRHRDRPQHLLFAEYPARLLQPDPVSAARWLRRSRPLHYRSRRAAPAGIAHENGRVSRSSDS